MEKIPMTRAGFAALEAELKKLKSEERPAIIKAIAEAREHGDLSENAEYHAARERQAFIEGRVGDAPLQQQPLITTRPRGGTVSIQDLLGRLRRPSVARTAGSRGGRLEGCDPAVHAPAASLGPEQPGRTRSP